MRDEHLIEKYRVHSGAKLKKPGVHNVLHCIVVCTSKFKLPVILIYLNFLIKYIANYMYKII